MHEERRAERAEIAGVVKKKDGMSASMHTDDSILRQFKDVPEWDGPEDRTAGGRP